jgi:hypothetical protein
MDIFRFAHSESSSDGLRPAFAQIHRSQQEQLSIASLVMPLKTPLGDDDTELVRQTEQSAKF